MRHHAGGLSTAPPFFGPARDRLDAGPGLAAQIGRLPGKRLVKFSIGGALKDPGDLGQQISPARCELAELGHRGGFLVPGQLTPSDVMPCRARELRDEDAVGVRSRTILIHPDRIEHGYGKSKLAKLISCGNWLRWR